MENKELLETIVAMQEEIIPAVRDAEQREDVPAPFATPSMRASNGLTSSRKKTAATRRLAAGR